jgi:hypothetical protein
MRQTLLPVMTEEGMILGHCTIPSTDFTGEETALNVDGYTYSIAYRRFIRPDGVPVTFSYCPVNRTDEREGHYRSLKNFSLVADIFHIDGWIQPGGICQAPHRTTSTLERLLKGEKAN